MFDYISLVESTLIVIIYLVNRRREEYTKIDQQLKKKIYISAKKNSCIDWRENTVNIEVRATPGRKYSHEEK